MLLPLRESHILANYRGCQTRVIRGDGGSQSRATPIVFHPGRDVTSQTGTRARHSQPASGSYREEEEFERGRSEVGRCRPYRVGAQDLQEKGPAGGCAPGSATQAALREAERSASAESGGGAPAQAFPRLTRNMVKRPASAGRLLSVDMLSRSRNDACICARALAR